ncbi:hypothetical protein QLL95_gp1182 [Cotonvirus japonicus]|uniref:Uncharacterized protein n=1 Tax=Cotonvirus japonicus TaxID=2811091 RepID=A0ABM7NS18_9VIRU|nr:hypothetical protein QLL95_gp1182 [Cotonvirus japonicus]BCS82941.1 hypothetical protein [Cotonvirus japonicus]
MNRKKIINIVNELVNEIDLNYIIAEAERYNYNIMLVHGNLDANICWSENTCHLPYNYELAVNVLYHFIEKNFDKIIKLKVTHKYDDIYGMNRNTIIYVPYKNNINEIKKLYYDSIHQ